MELKIERLRPRKLCPTEIKLDKRKILSFFDHITAKYAFKSASHARRVKLFKNIQTFDRKAVPVISQHWIDGTNFSISLFTQAFHGDDLVAPHPLDSYSSRAPGVESAYCFELIYEFRNSSGIRIRAAVFLFSHRISHSARAAEWARFETED